MKTGGMTLVTYDVIGEQEWEDMAPTAERSASEWDRLLDDLEQGKIISMPYTDLSDRRSKRMTVPRRGNRAGAGRRHKAANRIPGPSSASA
jgi:hypothetical protein